MVSASVISTRSPHESPKKGIRPAPKRIFQVMTFRLSIVSGGLDVEDAVYISALSISSKVVTNGLHEKRIANSHKRTCFKLIVLKISSKMQ